MLNYLLSVYYGDSNLWNLFFHKTQGCQVVRTGPTGPFDIPIDVPQMPTIRAPSCHCEVREMTIETERQQFRREWYVCIARGPSLFLRLSGTPELPCLKERNLPNEISQVFNLRCPACHKEKPYWTREIVNFEGTPEHTVPPARPASVRPFQQGKMTKVAKA